MDLFFVSQPRHVAWSSAQVSCAGGFWSSRARVFTSSLHTQALPVVEGDAPPRSPPLLLPRAAKREAVLPRWRPRLLARGHRTNSRCCLGRDCAGDLWLGVPVPKAVLAQTRQTLLRHLRATQVGLVERMENADFFF